MANTGSGDEKTSCWVFIKTGCPTKTVYGEAFNKTQAEFRQQFIQPLYQWGADYWNKYLLANQQSDKQLWNHWLFVIDAYEVLQTFKLPPSAWPGLLDFGTNTSLRFFQYQPPQSKSAWIIDDVELATATSVNIHFWASSLPVLLYSLAEPLSLVGENDNLTGKSAHIRILPCNGDGGGGLALLMVTRRAMNLNIRWRPYYPAIDQPDIAWKSMDWAVRWKPVFIAEPPGVIRNYPCPRWWSVVAGQRVDFIEVFSPWNNLRIGAKIILTYSFHNYWLRCPAIQVSQQ